MSQNKTVLVTGASRGIGRGIALQMAEEGYDVAITYSTAEEDAIEVANLIESKFGTRCFYRQATINNEGQPEEVVAWAIEKLGHLDALVNNAGVTRMEPLQEITHEILSYLINLNFRGYVLCAAAAARHMIENQIKGSIVSIVSTRGFRAYPGDGIYGGLKAGIIRATESFALDVSEYGIRVNCVAPGATQVRFDENTNARYDSLSKRIPLLRQGQPWDIAQAVSFLISDKSSYITGTTIKVDGGLILPGMPEWGSDVSWTPSKEAREEMRRRWKERNANTKN